MPRTDRELAVEALTGEAEGHMTLAAVEYLAEQVLLCLVEVPMEQLVQDLQL